MTRTSGHEWGWALLRFFGLVLALALFGVLVTIVGLFG